MATSPELDRAGKPLAETVTVTVTGTARPDFSDDPTSGLQRFMVGLFVAVPLAALTALAAARDAPRALVLGGLAILAIAALGNAWLGGYHAGVEWKLWQGPTECTGPIGDFGSASNLLERLKTVKVIRCDEVQWRFLGLSLAGYNVLISLLMAAIAAWGIVGLVRRK